MDLLSGPVYALVAASPGGVSGPNQGPGADQLGAPFVSGSRPDVVRMSPSPASAAGPAMSVGFSPDRKLLAAAVGREFVE